MKSGTEAQDQTTPESKKGIGALFHSLIFKSGLFLVLASIMIVLTVFTKGIFIRPSNIINILIQTTVVGITAVGMTFVIIDQGIDLSVGGIAALTSAVGAILMVKVGMPWILAVLCMMLISTGVGFLNGVSVAKLKMAPFIVTLAMMKITQGFAQFILGGQTIFGLPENHTVFGQARFLFIPVSVWILALLTVLGYLALKYSFFGRELYAMGGNPEAAWLSGINVVKTKIIAYMLSGFMAGCAALIITSRIMCAQITIGQGLELDAIAAAVIGGVSLSGGEGNVIGAVTGAVIITMINNGLNLLGVSPFLQTAVKGLVIFAAIAFDEIRIQRSNAGEKTSI